MTHTHILGIIASDAVWLALITAISTVILAWMQKSNKLELKEKLDESVVKLDRSNAKLDDAKEKRGVIHDLVNSNYTELATRVKSADDRLEAMQGIMDELVKTLRAQETSRSQHALELPVVATVPATLEKIEEHTEETAKNTARTDKAVAEMGAGDAASRTDPA